MVRYQRGSGDGGLAAWTFDAFVSYLIMGPALRIMGGVQHTEISSNTAVDASGNTSIQANAVQLGVQAIFF
jgi:hypothetical protein